MCEVNLFMLKKKKQFIDEILYFMNNKKKMRYDNFRERNLFICSEAIESANKYIDGVKIMQII